MGSPLHGGPVTDPTHAAGRGSVNGPRTAANLLAVYGSPRKGGNTSILLDYFLEGFESAAAASPGERAGGPPDAGASHPGASPAAGYRVERVHLRDLSLSHCTECGRCRETGVCVIQDDMSGYYDKLLTCGRIVMAFPVFFLGPPAVTKAFIDRAQSLWVRKYVLGIKPKGVESRGGTGGERKGFLLSVGGFKGSGRIFDCNKSVVKAFFMTCGVKYAGELLIPGVDGFGEIKNVKDAADRAREAGKAFAI